MIVTSCPEAFPGVTTALRYLESVTGLTKHIPLKELPDSEVEPSMVLFGGFCGAYNKLIPSLRAQGVPVGVWYCSSIGQTGFSYEYIEVTQLTSLLEALRKKELDFLWMGNRLVAESLKHLAPVDYLPYLIPVKKIQQSVTRHTEKDDNINVSLFCPFTLRKNVLNQLTAVSILQHENPKIKLHVNDMGEPWRMYADQLGLRLQEHGWMTRPTYLWNVKRMDVGLQVSYCETGNYVSMEHFALGTPCVMSHTQSWAGRDKYITGELVVDNFDSPVEIAGKVRSALGNGFLPRACLNLIKRVNRENTVKAKEVLEPWI